MTNENEIMMKIAKKPKLLTVLKIVGSIIYGVITVAYITFFLVFFIDIASSEEGLGKGIGAALFIIIMAVSACACAVAYIAPIALGIVGLVATKKRLLAGQRRGSTIYFIIMIALPVLTLALEFGAIFLIKLIA